MDLACGIVPVEHEAKVLGAFPINVNLIVLLEYTGEMFDVFLLMYCTPKLSTMRVKLIGHQL
jgi:hypothetical protein